LTRRVQAGLESPLLALHRRNMKVAIVAYYFPPHPAVGTTRPENWAQWLGEHSDLYVITPYEGLPNKSQNKTNFRIARTGVTFQAALEMFNTLRKKCSYLWSKLESGRAAKSEQSESVHSGVLTYRMPCLHDCWCCFAVLRLIRLKPEVVIATHSPYANLLAAWIYCLFDRKCKLWVDFRDPWVSNRKAIGIMPFRLLEQYLEAAILRSASLVTTTSEGFKLAIGCDRNQCAIRVIHNTASFCYPKSDKHQPSDPHSITFVYTGLVEQRANEASILFSSIRKWTQEQTISPTKLRMLVAGADGERLKQVAEREGCCGLVQVLGQLSRRDIYALQHDADVLILLENETNAASGVIPAKIYEYLLCGRPILMLGPTRSSEVHALITGYGRGIDLQQLRDVIIGRERLPRTTPTDTRELMAQRLIDCFRGLTKPKQT
jgi:hypothetical protein